VKPASVDVTSDFINDYLSQHLWLTWYVSAAQSEKAAAAVKPAREPSRLTAPSVPRGTCLREVMRYVEVPYACRAHRVWYMSPKRLANV
jgi:hypothetical protein